MIKINNMRAVHFPYLRKLTKFKEEQIVRNIEKFLLRLNIIAEIEIEKEL